MLYGWDPTPMDQMNHVQQLPDWFLTVRSTAFLTPQVPAYLPCNSFGPTNSAKSANCKSRNNFCSIFC